MRVEAGHTRGDNGAPMPRGGQVVRQWRLLTLVSRPGGVTIADGARELDCTGRTVWRDLAVLEAVGFPIYDDRDGDGRRGVWRVRAGFHHGLPVPLALDEIVAVLLAEKLLSPASASPLGPAIASFVGKLRALLTPQALALVDAMAARVGVRALGAKLQAPAAEHVPEIGRALRERRQLRLRYYSMSRDAETERRVDPYHLTYFATGLYLVGHCHLRGAVRVFAVERIRAVDVLPGTFTMPADFDVHAYLASAWGLIRGDVVTVVARFAPAVAPYVRERLWHPSQKLRDLPDRSLEMTLGVADTIEVRRWLLGFGAEVEVVTPASLREALRREAERLVARLAPAARGSTARKPPAPSPAVRQPLSRRSRGATA